ncbi:MAG: ATP-binding cassette domain-containing protein [Epsilonproteobacteria bacterium]|nr:ATP-binding cassette domain-containing protein [Campylobacterota bacterium]
MKERIVVEAKDIITRFGEHTIHNGVSFKIQQGEIFGLLGGSGSGKTTLLREMIMLQKIQGGQMKVLGVDVSKASHVQAQKLMRQWGILFQFGALFTSLTVLENVMIAMREYTNLPDWIIQESARMKLSMVGLPTKVATMFPSELSGGMKKRAGLARALALDPKLLFLDEPTSGLDPKSACAFDELIATLRKTLGISVVMVTHDKDTIENVLDRFIILGNQKVRFEGSMETLRQTTDEELKNFLN